MNDNSLPRANKTLGQHFLNDQDIIEKITSDFSSHADAILEVGPGPGILTKTLAEHKLPIFVIEKDQRFPELLEKIISNDNICLADALELNLEEFIDEKFSSPSALWLVSNLPYNISTPLTIRFLKCPKVQYMTLMYQREVADKIFPFDTRKGKAMSSLHALMATYFDIDLLCKVPPGAFTPPPKVESAVLKYSRKKEYEIPLEQVNSYEKFLRHLFSQRRKQVQKVLKSFYPQETIMKALDKLEIDPRLRSEAFTLSQVQLLYKQFHMTSN
jgi:16S rRNA (adenine1518-N6/adenine1519-N6)-dimethyltransferase